MILFWFPNITINNNNEISGTVAQQSLFLVDFLKELSSGLM